MQSVLWPIWNACLWKCGIAGGDFLVMLEPEEKQMEETEPEGNICGTVAYMAEQGKGEAKSVCEVAEAVLRLEDSQTVMELLAEELVRKAAADWEIHFLETGFWDKRVLSGFLEDAIAFEKPIIMAKIIEAGKEDELLEELRSARVYLNEIV